MKANPEMQPYYDIWFGLQHLYEQWAKRYGLTAHAMFVLYCIAKGEGRCTQKQICEQLLLPKQTVHTILNGFEEKGWLVRQVMEMDKRNKHLLLTAKGAEYADGVLGELAKREDAAMGRMHPQQRRTMLESNSQFFETFSRVMEEGGPSQE